MKFLNKHKRVFLIHGIVSICCGSVEYISFLLIYLHFGQKLSLSYFISYLLATTLGYALHNLYTFQYRKFDLKSASAYVFQTLVVLVSGYIVIRFYIELYNPQMAKFLQLCTTFLLNLTIGKNLTFKKVKGE